MPKSPGTAKAKPKKPRARKAVAKKTATKPDAVPAVATDWPPNLDDTRADALFDAIESGDFTVKTAAPLIGEKGNTVYQWRRRYPKFGERLDEAVDIGIDMAIDAYREIEAFDRDSAAGANVKIAVTDKYLQRKRPERFHINPFKPAAGGGEGGLLGIVLVPMKSSQVAQERPVIEGTAVRVPAKQSGA